MSFERIEPSVLLANGAMGLGLEQWALPYWLAYVAATVGFEAWFIGRWVNMPPWRSFGAAAAANVLTGFCCAVGGLFAPILHGGSLVPNPLLDSVVLLTSFSLPSGFAETIVWRLVADPRVFLKATDGRLLGGSLIAHLVGIPLALSILLLPGHPYPYVELRSMMLRKHVGLPVVAKALTQTIHSSGKVPILTPDSVEALVRRNGEVTDEWAALYLPEFRRFDTGEARRRPLAWNRSLSGVQIASGKADWRLLAHGVYRYESIELWVDLSTGNVRTRKPPDADGWTSSFAAP